MPRPATRGILPILAVLCAFGFFACKGGDQTAASPSNAPSSAIGSDPSPTKLTSREVGIGVEVLRLMPEDSALVYGVNLAQLKTSAVWAEIVEPELRRPEVRERLERFKTVCGFDPIAAVASVVGNDGYWRDVPEAVTIMRFADGVTKASLTTCLRRLFANSNGTELIAHTEDLYTFRAAPNWYALKFLDDATIVAVAGPRVTSSRIHELLSDSGLRWSGAFTGLVHRLDVGAPAWALVDLQPKAFQQLGLLDTDATAAYVKLSLSDGMRFDFRVRMPSPEAAENAAQASQEHRARALERFSINVLEMTSDRRDLLFTAAPSRLELAAFVAKFRAFVQKAEASAKSPERGDVH